MKRRKGGHLLCDTSTCITPASGEGIGSTDNTLVEETSAPDLTWDEGSSQNSNEKSEGNQALGTGDQTSHSRRNGSANQ